MNQFEETPLSEMPLVVLDTETTGLHAGMGHRVVEIGAVRFENWREVGQISQLVQPDRSMETRASQISGITDAELVGQPHFVEVADELLQLVDGALMVAHNAPFDANFIGLELWLAGKYNTAQPLEPILPNPWLCTLQLARRYFHFGKNNLSHVAHQLGVRIGKAHRALNDVYMTGEILKRMMQQLKQNHLQTVGDLLYAQGGAVYTATPPRIKLPAPIDQAVAENRELRILYINNKQTVRNITPLYATQHYDKTYLIADCHLRKERRTFRLDLIFSAEIIS